MQRRRNISHVDRIPAFQRESIGVIIRFGLMLLLVVSFPVRSQKLPATLSKSAQMFAEMSHEEITAVLDTFSGRFSVRTTDEKNILFYRSVGVTSYINVRLGSRVYTSNGLAGYGTPEGTRSLGKGKFTKLPDRLRYEWKITFWEGSWRIVQELIPLYEGEDNFVTVDVKVTNESLNALPSQIAIVEDLEPEGKDGAVINIDGRRIDYQQRITPVPDGWSVGGNERAQYFGKLTRDGSTKPAVVIVGQYAMNGYLGAAGFDYVADSMRITDCATLAQWDAIALLTGKSMSAAVSVGKKLTKATTWGKHFYVPWGFAGSGLGPSYTFISDSLATVTFSIRKDSGEHKITFVVPPLKPIVLDYPSYLNTAFFNDRFWYDSLAIYRYPFEVESDKNISVIISADRDVSTVLQPTESFTEYVFPGTFWEGSYSFLPKSQATRALVLPMFNGGRGMRNGRICYPDINYTIDTACVIRKGRLFEMTLTREHSTAIRTLYVNSRERIHDPYYQPWRYPFDMGDGSGSTAVLSSPTSVWVDGPGIIINLRYFERKISGAWCLLEQLLPNSFSGTKYFCVPYQRPTAKKPGDFFKILPLEDGTEITINGMPYHRTVNRFEFLDTLIAEPIEIIATKPVLVYQYSTSFHTAQSDTIGCETISSVLAERMWKRKFFCVQQIMCQTPPTVFPPMQPDLYTTRTKPVYEFITIVCRRGEERSITIDGVPIDVSLFKVRGEYAYVTLSDFKRFRLIESTEPIFVQMYGWQYGTGYAYVPPFK